MKIYNLGNRIVNNYLIRTENDCILIDTGYEGGSKRFQKNLKKYHIDPDEIKIIFLTHAHDDHAGFLNDVLRVTDANVILHPNAIEGLKRGQNSFEGGCSSFLAFAFCQLLVILGKGEHRYPAIREEYLDRLITIDSERFKALNLPFSVIETPGHTADHISLLMGDVLFCGDAAMNGFPSIRRTTIWIENVTQYRKSWERILELNPEMIYPAHGKPFPTADLKKYLPSLERVKLYPLKTAGSRTGRPEKQIRILIYGAGVIGSLYAVLFSNAGYDVSVLARGKRLEILRSKGLLYREQESSSRSHPKARVKKADATVLDHLADDDVYDFIFLTVRSEQADEALKQLKQNQSPAIVTMINSITDYSVWERIAGRGRILPAFPGAGGRIKNGVLEASLTPALIQPTTFGEIGGVHSERQERLAEIFRKSDIPYQIVPDMHHWQLCHLALVVPLADAYRRSRDPEHVYRDSAIMTQTAKALKRNLHFFQRRGMLSPEKFRIIPMCPVPVLTEILRDVYKSDFGDRFMYQHAMKAPEEMRLLHKELYGYIKKVLPGK